MVRVIEVVLQLRPRALRRTYLHPDPEHRHAMRWYTRRGRRIVWHEVRKPLHARRTPGPSMGKFLGAPVTEAALARILRNAR